MLSCTRSIAGGLFRRPDRKRYGELQRAQGTRAKRKVTCEECYFKRNGLCALDLSQPCATFRPHQAKLAPPPQLSFVFRTERRTRATWAFPSADEQAALHA